MAINIDFSKVVDIQQPTEKYHFIPCEVQFDGEAEVSNFFNTTICKVESASEDSETLTAVFRGRPLKGMEITLPAGYTGTVIKEPKLRTTEDEDRRLVATHSFDRFSYWNLDKDPTSDDLLQKGLQWIDISAAVVTGWIPGLVWQATDLPEDSHKYFVYTVSNSTNIQ